MAGSYISGKNVLVMILSVSQILIFIILGKSFQNFKQEQYRPIMKAASHNRTKLMLIGNMELFEMVKTNSVFRNFSILQRAKRESVNLLVIVSSAPKRLDRRNTIRQTWWSSCRSNNKVKVKCLFMTDKQNSSSKYFKQLNWEVEKFKDLEFQILGGGVEFGKRYLYHILWAVRNFEFDYILRLDDDYFICVDKIINELPMPALPLFHWGWVHCVNGITRPEESILMFSQDVIKLFLLQDPEQMRCHPWADQMIGLWVEDLGLKYDLKLRTDRRVHHVLSSDFLSKLLKNGNICDSKLGLHQSYPEIMQKLWDNRGNYSLRKETLIQNSDVCQSDLEFKWDGFSDFWKYEPRLCKDNPTWDTSKQGSGSFFKGRQSGFGK